MEIRRGTKLQHKHFGDGHVIDIEHSETDKKLTVKFSDGMKKLSHNIAKEHITVTGHEPLADKSTFEKYAASVKLGKKRKRLR